MLASPATGVSLAGVQSLRLEIDLAPPFLAPASVTFPNLRALSLGGSNRNKHVQHILSTASPKLKKLSLDELSAPLATELYIASFPKLRELRLCPGFSQQQLPPVLATSGIRDVAFTHRCRVTDELLLALLKGPTRMPKLRSLELNHVWASTGDALYNLLADGTPVMTSISEIREGEQSFRELSPEWPDGCTADGLRTIVDLAESAGITLSGGAIDTVAWEWDNDFEKQFEKFLVRSALVENNFDGLIEYYGSDKAGKAIVRHAPVLANFVFSALQRRSSDQEC